MVVSRPPARHQKPSPQSPARVALYDGPHDEALYGEAAYDSNPYDGRYDEGPSAEPSLDDARYAEPRPAGPYAEPRYSAPYAEAPYGDFRYAEAPYGDVRYAEASYDDVRYAEASYDDVRYLAPRYDAGLCGEAPYDEALHNEGRPAQAASNQARYDQAPFAQATYDQGRHHDGHDRGVSDRRRPLKIAAAMAGSTLLVAGTAPVAAHFWHRPATHPTALDQENPASTPGAALGAGPRTPGQPAAPENTLAQWAQVPIGKHAAAQVSAAKRAVRRATPQPSHSPQPKPSPKATASSAYQNPLRAVSDLELERVDMGVDFGGAGPVYALGDGVITNATGDSSGWPGGGWITYQLTDGPDAGLVVYVAEDVKPTVEVGQKVTSSTVIANMFNGGDGIETGWATSDSSTAESQMAAAGGISGGGPFPTMVGLSFDAVLESVGVPAAPNANEAGNGLLPAGYPPT